MPGGGDPTARFSYRRSRRFRAQARTLGGFIRELRLRHGWTLENTAERIRIDLKYLQKIEAGLANPTLATLGCVADALDVELVVARSGAQDVTRHRAHAHENPSGASGDGEASRGLEHLNDVDRIVANAGRRVGEVRSERGLTQKQLACAADVTLGFVQRLETGRQKAVALRVLARLAFALGVPMAALLTAPTRPGPRRGRPPRARPS
jgi:transcriptional regulator with XRE-family HTH domain